MRGTVLLVVSMDHPHNIREKINYVILNSPITNDDRLGPSYSRNRINSNWDGGRWDFSCRHSSDVFGGYACSITSCHVHRVNYSCRGDFQRWLSIITKGEVSHIYYPWLFSNLWPCWGSNS